MQSEITSVAMPGQSVTLYHEKCIKNRQALLMQCLPAIKIVKCYCEVSHVNRGSDYAMYFLKKPSSLSQGMAFLPPPS